jgi:hypothetical protein
VVVVEIRPSAMAPRRTVVAETPAPVKSATSPVHPDELPVERAEAPKAVVAPLTSKEGRIHLTVSRQFIGELRKARAGQSHLQPGATDEQALEAARPAP